MGLLEINLPYEVDSQNISWGPNCSDEASSVCLGLMNTYPFEPCLKIERPGKICDFTYATSQKLLKDGRAPIQNEEDADFCLVDSKLMKSNRYHHKYTKKVQVNRKTHLMQNQQMAQQQLNQPLRGHTAVNPGLKLYQQQQAQRQQQWQRNNRQRHLAEWSIEPQQDWVLIEIRQLSTLPRFFLNSSLIQYEDIDWRGELRVYDRLIDKILPKSSVALSDVYRQQYSYYWPGTSDDSILVNVFENQKDIHVAVTDQILACLMSAFQSRISWHLVFIKINDRLFIDKENGASVDLITVDETNKEAPLSDNPVRINRPAELGAEALKIQQNFSQQVLLRNIPPVKSYDDPPFVEDKDVPASKLYRYRIITLPEQPKGTTAFSKNPIKMVVRSEIDALMPGGEDHFLLIRTLHEYNPCRGGKSWKAQLDSQKGALIAQETKNNHCKVGKWVAQALISGCEYLKIGFLTRVAPDNNSKHHILNVQTHKVRDLGIQIGLNPDNAWGIVRAIIDSIMVLEDGTFTLVKDPIKPEIKLYRTSTIVKTDTSTESNVQPEQDKDSGTEPNADMKDSTISPVIPLGTKSIDTQVF